VSIVSLFGNDTEYRRFYTVEFISRKQKRWCTNIREFLWPRRNWMLALLLLLLLLLLLRLMMLQLYWYWWPRCLYHRSHARLAGMDVFHCWYYMGVSRDRMMQISTQTTCLFESLQPRLVHNMKHAKYSVLFHTIFLIIVRLDRQRKKSVIFSHSLNTCVQLMCSFITVVYRAVVD